MTAGGRVLAVLAAAFVEVLRGQGVATSPAEAIEVRRVMAMLGASDLATLRPGLRAVTVKYDHERAGFERSFDVFFGLIPAALAGDDGAAPGKRGPDAQGLPTDLQLDDDDSPASYADYNPNTPDIGDMVDGDERERGIDPHRDDDDVSLGGSDSDLSVSSDEDRGRRGTSYTVDLERAGSAVAKELTNSGSAGSHGSIDWDDPEAIIAWLAAHDPHSVYADGPDGELEQLSEAQLGRLVEAIAGFVSALAEEVSARERPDRDPGGGSVFDPAGMQRACHELLHRMHGAPRRVPREHARGPLDVRHTVRRSMRTDGVPFHLVVRKRVPDRVRLLVVADVSLSVRSVTAFVLRLAQTLHRMAFRCRVLAYVDTLVDVTDLLMRASGDRALAAVLAAPGLDLDATSDYGRVMSELGGAFADAVDPKTAVLFVGDGRCNGLPSGHEELRRLRRRAHRVGWITPEPRRYWNQATCAMPVYSEIVDHVVVARDVHELLAGAGELGHALS